MLTNLCNSGKIRVKNARCRQFIFKFEIKTQKNRTCGANNYGFYRFTILPNSFTLTLKLNQSRGHDYFVLYPFLENLKIIPETGYFVP